MAGGRGPARLTVKTVADPIYFKRDTMSIEEATVSTTTCPEIRWGRTPACLSYPLWDEQYSVLTKREMTVMIRSATGG